MAKLMTQRRREVGEIQKMKNLPPPKQPKPPKHFVAITKGPIDMLVGLVFWKIRNEYPEFAMTFTDEDIRGFKASLDYKGQTPKFAADAREKFIVVRMVDAKTTDPLQAIENTEDDFQAQQDAKKRIRAKESASQLVSNVRAEFSNGLTSQESINALCEATLALAR